MLPVKIAGVAAALPARVVTSAELERDLDLPPGWIERRTGVRERRRAAGESALDLAAAAARGAIRAAGAPLAIRTVIAASTARHQLIPCTAALLMGELGLPEGESFAFDIDATCLSFLTALHVASRTLDGGAALIASSEVSRFSLDPSEPESHVLIGDGAAAAVLEAAGPGESRIHGAFFETHPSGAEHTCFLGGGSRHHPNDPATTRGMNLFRMNGPAVFKMALKLVPRFIERALAGLGWRAAEVDAVVPHQASAPGVDLLVSRCGFRPGQVVRNLETRGNCIAASVPIALAEAVAEGRVRRGDRVLLCGTGAGLSLGAVGLTY